MIDLERPVGDGEIAPLVPDAPVPEHHDLGRPLVVCAWDAPNMDMTLSNVIGAMPMSTTRPQFDVFARWLAQLAPPQPASAHDVEGVLFVSIQVERAPAIAPFVSAVRQAGLGVFCRDRTEGDIDDALVAFVGQRLSQRTTPGTLVVASADRELVLAAARPALDAGWRVIVVAYREVAGWVQAEGLDLVDPEDIPGLFQKPLVRFTLEALPPGGVFVPAVRPLRPAVDEQDTRVELLSLLDEILPDPGAEVLLAAFGQEIRRRSPRFAERLAGGTLTDLVESGIEGTDFALVDRGTPEVRLVRLTTTQNEVGGEGLDRADDDVEAGVVAAPEPVEGADTPGSNGHGDAEDETTPSPGPLGG